jgi:hypothetical protein
MTASHQIAILDNHHPDELGFVPDMVSQDDPRPAAEQFDANYGHGGGWHPIPGFFRQKDKNGQITIVLNYPGDPPYKPIACWPLRDELIAVYRYGIVAVFNIKTGAFEVARMD